MTVLNDVMKMQQQGKSEQDIVENLRSQGRSAKEISDALSQTKIKAAVAPPNQETPVPSEDTRSISPSQFHTPATQEYENLEPSMLPPGQQEDVPYPQPGQIGQQEELPYSQPNQESQQQEYQYQDYQDSYPQYEPSGISLDTITEISEQIVSEKLSELRKNLEKAIDFKSSVESKIDYIDDRLKRMEKIIDRLQLSVLQKVGDYMTSVTDVKKELTETQKSFKKLLPQLKQISGESQKRKTIKKK